MKTMLTLLALGAAVAAATPAMAAKTFTFTFDADMFSGDKYSGKATLTTDDGVPEQGGAYRYTITGITGSVALSWIEGDIAIGGLADGVDAFVLGNSGAYELGRLQVEFNGIPYYSNFSTKNGASFIDGVEDFSTRASFSVELETSAVPEAETWAQMIAGFGVLGGVMRRRRVTAQIATA